MKTLDTTYTAGPAVGAQAGAALNQCIQLTICNDSFKKDLK